MRALMLIANTPPLLVKNIIANKLGAKVLKVDPNKASKCPIIMFSDIKKARQAYIDGLHKKAIFISVCSPLDYKQIKGAIPLDFTPNSLTFTPGQMCRFNEIFDLYDKPKKVYKVRFKNKQLLQKIMDLKISSNIVSLGQLLLYDIAIKPKRKALRKLLVAWLCVSYDKRLPLDKFLATSEPKFNEMSDALKKKFKRWQKLDAIKPLAYGAFIKNCQGKTNKEVVEVSGNYGINSFDAISILGWLK